MCLPDQQPHGVHAQPALSRTVAPAAGGPAGTPNVDYFVGRPGQPPGLAGSPPGTNTGADLLRALQMLRGMPGGGTLGGHAY